MRVMEQSYEWVFCPHQNELLNLITKAGRTCYKSENKDTGEFSRHHFVRSLISRGHLSVIEHANITMKITTNRGVSHELVRHRVGSYSQESTRYCNYGGKGIDVIRPVWILPNVLGEYSCLEDVYNSGIKEEAVLSWLSSCMHDEKVYDELLSLGWRPEQAREVLPNSLKTEVVVTFNMRQWRHVLAQRRTINCHPQMVDIMDKIHKGFCIHYPEFMYKLETGGSEA